MPEARGRLPASDKYSLLGYFNVMGKVNAVNIVNGFELFLIELSVHTEGGDGFVPLGRPTQTQCGDVHLAFGHLGADRSQHTRLINVFVQYDDAFQGQLDAEPVHFHNTVVVFTELGGCKILEARLTLNFDTDQVGKGFRRAAGGFLEPKSAEVGQIPGVDQIHGLIGVVGQIPLEQGVGEYLTVLGTLAVVLDFQEVGVVRNHLGHKITQFFGQFQEGLYFLIGTQGNSLAIEGALEAFQLEGIGNLLGNLHRHFLLRFLGAGAQVRSTHHIGVLEQGIETGIGGPCCTPQGYRRQPVLIGAFQQIVLVETIPPRAQ